MFVSVCGTFAGVPTQSAAELWKMLPESGYVPLVISDWQIDSEPDTVIRTLCALIDRLTPARVV